MDLVGNDVDTLHEKKNSLVGFNFIRVYRFPNGLVKLEQN